MSTYNSDLFYQNLYTITTLTPDISKSQIHDVFIRRLIMESSLVYQILHSEGVQQ